MRELVQVVLVCWTALSVPGSFLEPAAQQGTDLLPHVCAARPCGARAGQSLWSSCSLTCSWGHLELLGLLIPPDSCTMKTSP